MKRVWGCAGGLEQGEQDVCLCPTVFVVCELFSTIMAGYLFITLSGAF